MEENRVRGGRLIAVPFLRDHMQQDRPLEILHHLQVFAEHDQIVPIADSALLSSKIVKNASLKVYKGAPHGMCTTHKDQVNADLLAFIKS